MVQSLWTANDIISATEAEWQGDGEAEFHRIIINSREASAGDVFVALIGDCLLYTSDAADE